MEQHVFSKNNKYFASISENGVLKVWDTETQELKCDYIPNLQTSAPCTSLIWVTLAQVGDFRLNHAGLFTKLAFR